MEKTIVIDGKDVKLNNNGAWAIEYRDQFGKDILPVLLPLVASLAEGIASIMSEMDTGNNELNPAKVAESVQGNAMDILLPLIQVEFVDMVYNVTWALAKNADPSIPEPKKWIRQFDTFYLDEIVPEVYGLIMQGFTSSKNLKRLEEALQTVKRLQPSH